MKEGAYDFITKPIQLKQLMRCISNALEKKRLRSELSNYQRNLEKLVQERTSQIQDAMRALEASHFDTINRLCHAAEYRDDETGLHVLRIGKYCELLSRELSLPEEEVFLLSKASPLHDVGKIGIPDQILLKPGKLTAEEFEIMKRHAEIGGEILKNANSKVIRAAETVARAHHEKWDGSGYPNGLKGEDIPIMGRIAAVADVFDALTMKRCYKPAFTWETSSNIINEGAGKHFDPKVVEAFNRRFRDFVNIHREYAEA
jgi:putative two-component system response regulator